MIDRTAENLVKFCISVLNTPYWFGCFGNRADQNLFNQKQNQYPDMYPPKSWTYESFTKDYGVRVCDCSGLLKWFLWSDNFENKAPTYKASEDYGATGFYSKCSERGELWKDNTPVLIPGVILFKGNTTTKSHMGVFIGDNKIIEAKGHAYGTIKSDLTKSWSYWGKSDFIKYDSAPVIKDKQINVETYQLKNGSVSSTVGTLQTLLNYNGYKGIDGKSLTVDNEFGKHTDNAVRCFQSNKKIIVDGVVGPVTWKALLNG